MKTQLHQRLGCNVLSVCPAILVYLLLLAALPTRADTSFTTTNWVAGVPVPGILATNASGQVYLKGNVHLHRVVSGDTRIAGRMTAWMDLAYQADGTALICGPAYGEPGTWDAAGINFTPSGGVWNLNYTGVIQADGRDVVHMAGYGMGGAIEGLRLECTATKGPGGSFDPAIPYVSSGTIKPAPVDTRVVVDDFADNQFTWPDYAVGPIPNLNPPGTFFANETNQQLTIGGTWFSTTPSFLDSGAWADLPHPWEVSAGQTLELRVDVIAFSQTANGVALALYTPTSECYGFVVARNYIGIVKEHGLAHLRAVRASSRDTNIVMSLALTPVGENVVLTGKVLDRDNGTVIAQVVATDTPDSDPCLSAIELAELTGGRV